MGGGFGWVGGGGGCHRLVVTRVKSIRVAMKNSAEEEIRFFTMKSSERVQR